MYQDNKKINNKWFNFKKWIYNNHKKIGIVLLIILILISFFQNEFMNEKVMKGGAAGIAAAGALGRAGGAGALSKAGGSGGAASALSNAADLSNLANVSNTIGGDGNLSKLSKMKALSGTAIGYGMDKARKGAHLLWDFLYQVAFVIIIIIIIFPSISLLIIGMVCYTLLKSKMANLKKL